MLYLPNPKNLRNVCIPMAIMHAFSFIRRLAELSGGVSGMQKWSFLHTGASISRFRWQNSPDLPTGNPKSPARWRLGLFLHTGTVGECFYALHQRLHDFRPVGGEGGFDGFAFGCGQFFLENAHHRNISPVPIDAPV